MGKYQHIKFRSPCYVICKFPTDTIVNLQWDIVAQTAFKSSFSLIDIRINICATLKLLRPFPYMTVYSILLLIPFSWGDLLCTCLMIILWYLFFYKTGSVVVPYLDLCLIGRRSVSGTSNFLLLIQTKSIKCYNSSMGIIVISTRKQDGLIKTAPTL